MPGVESVGIADSLPMQGAESASLKIVTPTSTHVDEIFFVSVSPEYFATLKVPILSGRSFQETDGPEASMVAIVNQTFAKRVFSRRERGGLSCRLREFAGSVARNRGVVSNFRQRNPKEDLRPMVYLPVAQTLPAGWSMAVRVRAASDVGSLAVRMEIGFVQWIRDSIGN